MATCVGINENRSFRHKTLRWWWHGSNENGSTNVRHIRLSDYFGRVTCDADKVSGHVPRWSSKRGGIGKSEVRSSKSRESKKLRTQRVESSERHEPKKAGIQERWGHEEVEVEINTTHPLIRRRHIQGEDYNQIMGQLANVETYWSGLRRWPQMKMYVQTWLCEKGVGYVGRNDRKSMQ